MKHSYDILVIGPLSLDCNIDHTGRERREIGGAVVASGFAAARSGARTAVFTKANPLDADPIAVFHGSGVEVFFRPSVSTCSIRNQYLTPDQDRRICTSLGVCDPFLLEEFGDIDAEVFQFAGLVRGDFTSLLFLQAARRAKVAVDAQCLLRRAGPDHSMSLRDWADKQIVLPYITYLKADAAEAEILTGTADLAEAARMLHNWGAAEVLITHSSGVLAYDGKELVTCPIRSRNLSGRTGRGDTAFAGYLAARQRMEIREALEFCTALVSLKMETPGPFRGTRSDVLSFQQAFYPECPVTGGVEP